MSIGTVGWEFCPAILYGLYNLANVGRVTLVPL